MIYEVKKLGAAPVFCTIIPSSLRAWNNTRLKQHKTAFLIHHNHYEDMQHLMIQTIQDINSYITTYNREHHMKTPRTADTVIRNMGHGQKRVQYQRLVDGVHAPSEEKKIPGVKTLTEKWALKLTEAMWENKWNLILQ